MWILGVFGLTVVTAVTAQNTREVRAAWPLPPEAVRTQIETVAEGFAIGAWKTGMLGNAATVRAVAESLPEGAISVIDPVMVSTSGHRLLEEDAISDLVEVLMPRASVVTPNIPEAEVLAGMRIEGGGYGRGRLADPGSRRRGGGGEGGAPSRR